MKSLVMDLVCWLPGLLLAVSVSVGPVPPTSFAFPDSIFINHRHNRHRHNNRHRWNFKKNEHNVEGWDNFNNYKNYNDDDNDLYNCKYVYGETRKSTVMKKWCMPKRQLKCQFAPHPLFMSSAMDADDAVSLYGGAASAFFNISPSSESDQLLQVQEDDVEISFDDNDGRVSSRGMMDGDDDGSSSSMAVVADENEDHDFDFDNNRMDANDAVDMYGAGGADSSAQDFGFQENSFRPGNTNVYLDDRNFDSNDDERSSYYDSRSNNDPSSAPSGTRHPTNVNDNIPSPSPTEDKAVMDAGERSKSIEDIAKSGNFPLPNVSEKAPSLITEWYANTPPVKSGIEVVLVTQCSLDRLSNLVEQLIHWGGKASVALYLKPDECTHADDDDADVMEEIMSMIRNVRQRAEEMYGEQRRFDIALQVVEGCIDGEAYPINYLRNIALLEAYRQHLRFNPSLDKSAVLLVDVDFRPSSDLFTMLHSHSAAESILEIRRVIVCPAFECAEVEVESITCTYPPQSLSGLKELVDNGQAEGFHLSHFPQGHEPTDFEKFWDKSFGWQSQSTNKGSDGNYENAVHNDEEQQRKQFDYFWQESYEIVYKELFEPYIVMASTDVPLYDERFQGYGLNKVSHLASVSALKDGKFFVLPGVFIVAPAHDRSESWHKMYGNNSKSSSQYQSQSGDSAETYIEFNQLSLKALYYNFQTRLESGQEPIVSENTRSKQQQLLGKGKQEGVKRNTVERIFNVMKSFLS